MNKSLTHVTGRDGLLGDLSQRNDRVLIVFSFDCNSRAAAKRARSVCSDKYELEPVGDFVDAVFDCDTCHAIIPFVAATLARSFPPHIADEIPSPRRRLLRHT